MPFARFERLAPEKRERLLDSAAQEFATYGFEQASLNRILEHAQMSKGAAYYYFEDKADLFRAVIQYVSERLHLADIDLDFATLTAENFWPMAAELRRAPLMRSFERPWLFRMISAAAHFPPTLLELEPLASLVHQIRTFMARFIKRGQELGVIRTDLPDDLIVAWLFALDQASDQWLMAHWEQVDRAVVARLSDQTVAALSRMLAPGVSPMDVSPRSGA